MEPTQKDIEIALRLLHVTRERGRKCYEKHKEERKAKRRAYYHAKKEQARATGGEGVGSANTESPDAGCVS
jgi:hypothetical protein